MHTTAVVIGGGALLALGLIGAAPTHSIDAGYEPSMIHHSHTISVQASARQCDETMAFPAEIEETSTPVVQPALAETGADFSPMLIAAGALLLGGVAAVGAVSATRDIRNPRP
ncbi:hypothetical protein [Agreia sp. COWG]|uniref:hypothetical protein n=1 Tax=Agreia sp. COWG TaxID=2773266 RepID=UPI001927563C|nr:hypothetical protein [Agreia sp. COWG]CAD6009703.1 protein of unknown function [Agreia sp. COWG]